MFDSQLFRKMEKKIENLKLRKRTRIFINILPLRSNKHNV